MTPLTHANWFEHPKASDIIRASAIAELLVGVWLYLSPWIYRVTSGTAFNGWVVGFLVAVAATFQLGCPGDTAELTGLVNGLLGIWVFASPWILGYSADTGRLVDSLCVGAIAFIAAVITFIAARWRATHPSYGDNFATRSCGRSIHLKTVSAMLSKHGGRNIAIESLVIMCAVAAATVALTLSLVARDLQIRSQRALGVTYTWTWTNNADPRAQPGAPTQQVWSGAGLPRVGSLTSLILMGSAAVLIAGIVFSLLKMQRPVPSASSRRAARHCDAFQAALVRIERAKLLEQSTNTDEPYPHHETHPESPGEDQGQLTSHLSGSTPFFEGVNSAIRRSSTF
jgi:hypothetical protein